MGYYAWPISQLLGAASGDESRLVSVQGSDDWSVDVVRVLECARAGPCLAALLAHGRYMEAILRGAVHVSCRSPAPTCRMPYCTLCSLATTNGQAVCNVPTTIKCCASIARCVSLQ